MLSPLPLPPAEASGSKGRSKAGGSSGGGAGGEVRPPSGDLLTKAVLLYPEAVVRLQVRLQGNGGGGLSAGPSLLPAARRARIRRRRSRPSHPRRVPASSQRVLQGKGVGQEREWGEVLARPLFAGASDGGSASLSHLLDIWVERHHLLWKVRLPAG